MNKVDKSTLYGALIGSLASGTAYEIYRKRKGRRRNLKSAILSILGGALAGGAAGRSGYGVYDYIKRSRKARELPEGQEKRPGTVYYVSHPENSIDVSDTGTPAIDAVSSRIMKAFGWDGKIPIGHAGIVTVDADGNAKRLDYGRFTDVGRRGSKGSVFERNLGNVKGMSHEDFVKMLQEDGDRKGEWGGTVDVASNRVDDIGVAERYMHGLESPDSDDFGILPGGYSCGTAARSSYEAARGGWIGKALDMLIGGLPSSNLPTYGSDVTHYEKKKVKTK